MSLHSMRRLLSIPLFIYALSLRKENGFENDNHVGKDV